MDVATLPNLPALREAAKVVAKNYRSAVLVPTEQDAAKLVEMAEKVGGSIGAGMMMAAASWWSELRNYPAALCCDHKRDRMLSDAVVMAVRKWNDEIYAATETVTA